MIGRWTKYFAAQIGGGAMVALVVVGAVNTGDSPSVSLAGSGDSATATNYAPPSVPGMNIGATMTTTTPAAQPVTSKAVPAAQPTAPAPCSTNGVVLPGGCH